MNLKQHYMKRTAVLLAMIMVFAGLVSGQTVEELLTAGKGMIDKNDGLALKKFEKVLEMEPKNYTALHEASLLYSRLGNRLNTKDEKGTYFRKAKDLAQQAIDVNGGDPEGHFVMGVALGRISLISGSKEKVANVRGIKKHAEEAIRLNNRHAGAWHLLGRVHVGAANASKAERIAANTFFGGLPKDCSTERGIECYKFALKYRPNFILYQFDLSEAFYFDEQFTECEEALNALMGMKNTTLDDPATKKSAKEMLAQF